MDEDQSELLADSDNESVTESEDQCLPIDKSAEQNRHNLIYVSHSKTEFVTAKIILLLSTLLILILLPLYMETVSVYGDVYGLLLTNTFSSAVILVLLTIIMKYVYSSYKNICILKLPIKLTRLGQLSLLYFLSAILLMYALDRKRVACHLQDPMKALILVWSFLYYFFFCERFMCLRRIFSVTVIIIGLFITVDYSLCNEFKCRGYERQHISDDTGGWTWQTHAMWTSVYVVGLALCAAYFTLLEHSLTTDAKRQIQNTNPTPLVNTVSSSVSTTSACSSTQTVSEDADFYKRINVIHLTMWLHVFGIIILTALFWSDFVPHIGKSSNSTTVLNYTINSIRCHFVTGTSCNNVAMFSWLFLFGYLVFVIVSIQFLILTQSAVYTVATMATALPLAQIWWSFFQMVPAENGLIVWNPAFTGELVSSFLGLPVVITGLYFLYKSHFKDWHWLRNVTANS